MKHSCAWYGVGHLSVCQFTNARLSAPEGNYMSLSKLHPFMQHTVIERPLCARHCSRLMVVGDIQGQGFSGTHKFLT